MSNWIVIPVKRLSEAKSRLGGILNSAERRQLSASMLFDVLTATMGTPEAPQILVVTSDPAVSRMAVESGSKVLADDGIGLNQAVRRAIAYSSRKKGTRMVVVHADLPLIQPHDLSLFLRVEAPGMMIAPSRDFRGTNLLALTPPDLIIPRYGRRSFDRHNILAEKIGIIPTIVENERLALDIDTPHDLKRLCELSPGGRTGKFLAAQRVLERLRQLPQPRIRSQPNQGKRKKLARTRSKQAHRLTVRR